MIRYQDIDHSITQDNLHPDDLFHKELLLAKDFVAHAEPPKELDPCPMSGESRHEVFFEKWGLAYAFCPRTWNLSLGSIPSEDTLQRYFHDSELSRLRAAPEYQEHLSQRRHSLWQHQMEWIEGRIQRYLRKDKVDLINWGIKAQGWQALLQQAPWIRHYASVSPLPPVTDNDHGDSAEVVCLFDVIQRSGSPKQLLRDVADRLQPGGLLLASCRSGSGFDVLTLGGASDSIFPYDHVCLPSPAGMAELIRQTGLELLELTTPGMLDVQLVRAAEKELPQNRYFQRYLLEQGSQDLDERLQQFLQQNNLSSHLRIVARKPGTTA